MAQPIELRQYLRKLTLDDVRNHIQPIRLPLPDGRTELYGAAVFQYRYREKIHINGVATMQWSDWIDVSFVREGMEETT